jgi:multicomponent Na+:H+ antiporter subunit G
MDISMITNAITTIVPWLLALLPLMLSLLGYGLMIVGGFFILTSALGLLRMPDFLSRLHPAGVGDSVGAPLLLLGLALQYGWTIAALKLILLALFFLITSPTACHALAKAAIAGTADAPVPSTSEGE